MKKTIIIASALSVLLLQGCSSKAMLVKPGETNDLSSESITYVEVDVDHDAISHIAKTGFLDPGWNDYELKKEIGPFCNYFIDTSCRLNTNGHHLSLVIRYFNFDYDGHKESGWNLYIESYLKKNKDRLYDLLFDEDAKYMITVTGVSTKQQVTVFPEVINRKPDSGGRAVIGKTRGELAIARVLRGKLLPDPAGFVISGMVSVVLPNRFISNSKDYGARLILPLQLGVEKDNSNKNVATYKTKRSNNSMYRPDRIQTTYYGIVAGFSLGDKIAEYTGMIDASALTDADAEQIHRISEITRKNKESADAFARNKESMRLAIQREGLGEVMQRYADIKEVCDRFRSQRNSISDVECGSYRGYSSPELKAYCRSRKQELLNAIASDESQYCRNEQGLKQRLAKFYRENPQLADSLVGDAMRSNNIDSAKLFPYLEDNIYSEMRDYVKGVERQDREAHEASIRRAQRTDLNAMRQRLLAPMPGAEIVRQTTQNMKDYVDNQNRIEADYEQQRRDRRSSISASASSSGSNSSSTSAGKQRSQTTANTSSATSSQQSSQMSTTSHNIVGVSNQGPDICHTEHHKLPVMTVEDTAFEAVTRMDKMKNDYMKSKCSASYVSGVSGKEWKREVLKEGKKGTTQQDYIRLTTHPDYGFSCGCVKEKSSGTQGASGGAAR